MERDILLFIQEYIRNSFLNPIMVFISTLGDNGMIWIILSLFLLFRKKTRKAGILAVLSLSICFLVNNVCIKNLAARIRPYETIEELTILVKRPWDYSFPSGHTCSSFAAAGIYLRCLDKRWGIAAIILACLIGFSRMYVGVHYPSDVLTGALTGIAGSQIVYYFSSNYKIKMK